MILRFLPRMKKYELLESSAKIQDWNLEKKNVLIMIIGERLLTEGRELSYQESIRKLW